MPVVASYHGLVISCFLAHEQGLNYQGFPENGMIIRVPTEGPEGAGDGQHGLSSLVLSSLQLPGWGPFC